MKDNQNIVIVDYGMGNIHSVYHRFNRLGIKTKVTSEKNMVIEATKLILPGVGHFASGMKNLNKLGLIDILNQKVINEKTPILGICLGMQLLTVHSEEGNVNGLAWINARTVKFDIKDKLRYKIPHMGWNTILPKKESFIFEDIKSEDLFYFVHSYHVICDDSSNVLSTTDYEYTFASSIVKENIYGTQFHPEKSHDSGNKLLKNFINH